MTTTLKLICLIALVRSINAWPQIPRRAEIASTNRSFDGVWWSKIESDERSGFMNGAADCLTWTAHEEGFSGTPEQIMPKITEFYKSHPDSTRLDVIEVWRQVWRKMLASPPGKRLNQAGETWKNPHWYLNGDWWSQLGTEQRQGYVEGYLWCIRNCVREAGESYSRSVSYYSERIDKFIDEHPRSNEPVATTLRRYRDKSARVSPK